MIDGKKRYHLVVESKLMKALKMQAVRQNLSLAAFLRLQLEKSITKNGESK